MMSHQGMHTVPITCLLLVLRNVVDCRLPAPDTEATEIITHVINEDQTQHHYISSPNFPNCCRPVKYLLVKGNREDDRYWKLLFTDLDLPYASTLLIHGIKEPGREEEPIGTVLHLNGTRTRPVIKYQGHAISVEFHPGQTNQKEVKDRIFRFRILKFLGFKAMYWLDRGTWDYGEPYTICPPLGDVLPQWQRSQVTVTNLTTPQPKHYRFYCVWLIKPVADNEFHITITLQIPDGSDAIVKVRRGLTSTSPVVLSASFVKSEDISSREGFYIEMSKPADKGTFILSYSWSRSRAYSRDSPCLHNIGGKTSLRGFRCGKMPVCLPYEKKCNGVKDCPNGYDEKLKTCGPQHCFKGRCEDGRCPRKRNDRCPEDCPQHRTKCPGTLLCLHHDEQCPDEECVVFQQKCADGSCVASSLCQDGSEPCHLAKRRCEDGTCVEQHGLCKEDPCPKYTPYRCVDDKCLPMTSLCDGISDCSDGADEQGCFGKPERTNDENGNGRWLCLLLLLILPLGYCGYYVCYKWCTTGKRTHSDGFSGEEQGRLNPPQTYSNGCDVASTVIQGDSCRDWVTDVPGVVSYPSHPIISSGPPSSPSDLHAGGHEFDHEFQEFDSNPTLSRCMDASPSAPSNSPYINATDTVPSAPASQPDASPFSAPPSYSEVVNNPSVYQKPPDASADALPSYDSVASHGFS